MIASENYKKPQRGGTTFKVQKSTRNTREKRLRQYGDVNGFDAM
ncbi:hypothetical protein [Christensenella minuta]|nr:hypothetical protein [Christensenella minuta]